jgi:molybdopterin-guanine dinucleotide biosynthesis protein A
MTMSYDGIVLAGGRARRLDGVVKPALRVGGNRLLDIALDALAGAATTIVVGARIPTVRDAEWTREVPAGSGPVAGLAAALDRTESQRVVVLAADLPFVTRGAVEQLVRSADERAGAIAVDHDGRDQPLLGCFDTVALRSALPEQCAGAPMRSVLTALERVGRLERVDLGGNPPATWDCDTADDLQRARELA